ncbi:hypothetical protein [Ferrovibrio terrae]|uniref:hypothetical protein n=1 Tax=Ferrovibrio terrae TaxID=2594003 RepID=UPI00313845FD
MHVNARAAEPFFRISNVTLADSWGLTRIDTETFFRQVHTRLEWYRASLVSAGYEASVMNMVRLHLESMDEDDAVDQAVLAALNWATSPSVPTSPVGGGIPCLAMEAA